MVDGINSCVTGVNVMHDRINNRGGVRDGIHGQPPNSNLIVNDCLLDDNAYRTSPDTKDEVNSTG
jgi:hypothetical protein